MSGVKFTHEENSEVESEVNRELLREEETYVRRTSTYL
jgi:hypothetical protein